MNLDRISKFQAASRLFGTPKAKRGQAMMEYIIVVALIAVASIPIMTIFGNIFRDRVMHAADQMVNGEGASQHENQAKEELEKGENRVRRGMNNFYR